MVDRIVAFIRKRICLKKVFIFIFAFHTGFRIYFCEKIVSLQENLVFHSQIYSV